MLFVKMEITLDCRNQIVTRSKLSEYSTFRIWEYPKIPPWERYQCIRRHVTNSAACWRQSVCRERFCLCTAISSLLCFPLLSINICLPPHFFFTYINNTCPFLQRRQKAQNSRPNPFVSNLSAGGAMLSALLHTFCAQNSTGFSFSEP